MKAKDENRFGGLKGAVDRLASTTIASTIQRSHVGEFEVLRDHPLLSGATRESHPFGTTELAVDVDVVIVKSAQGVVFQNLRRCSTDAGSSRVGEAASQRHAGTQLPVELAAAMLK